MTSAMNPSNGVPEWTLTDRLRKARERTGLKPEAFADEIDVSKSTVYNYENPEFPRQRKPIALKRWAVRCGVPYEWLVTGETGSDGGPGLGVTNSGCIASLEAARTRRSRTTPPARIAA